MLTVSAPTIAEWHNAAVPDDVNGDGIVSAADALMVINDLNANGSHADGAVATPSLAGASPASQTNTHDYLDVNADGFVSPADALAVINQLDSTAPEVDYRLQIADTSGNPVSTLQVGENFEVEVFVTDLRSVSPSGVQAAYLNTAYTNSLANLTGITHASPYTNDISADTTTAGEINDAGGTASSTATGSSEMLLETFDFTATATGTLSFTPSLPSPNTDSTHATLLYNDSTEPYVDPSEIETNYTSISITEPTTTSALSIADVTQSVGTSGVTDFVFPVTLGNPSSTQVTVGYATQDQTAIAGTDYAAQSGSLTFTPGQTTQDITVPVYGTSAISANKTFLVNLSSAVGAPISRAQAIGTIVNSNIEGFSVSDPTVLQPTTGTTNAVFTVTLPQALGNQSTVQYATANGTSANPATAGIDYTATSGTLTFAAGVTSEQVTVPVFGNASTHPDQTFTLNLSNPVGTQIVQGTATATIVNESSLANDEAEISLEVVDASGNEITTPLTAGQTFYVDAFVKDLTPAAEGVFAAYLNVSYPSTLAEPLNNADAINFGPNYTTFTSGSLTTLGLFTEIGAASNSTSPLGSGQQLLFSVPMQATGSGVLQFDAEPATIFPQHDVLLFGQDAVVPVTQVEYVNSNSVDVGQNAFSIDSPPAVTDTAAGTQVVFTVTRVLPTNTTATVNYATADGTATAGIDPSTGKSDYTATSGSLTFAPGGGPQQITVLVTGTTADEPSKDFFVNLSGAVNAAIGVAQGKGTIDYSNAAPSATIANASAGEGTSIKFPVTLSQASGFPITISYATTDGTAVSGVNYTGTSSGTVSFAPGQTTAYITVPTSVTQAQTGSLNFTVTLSNPSNVTLTNTTATGTITYVTPTSISGFVYVDANGDGQDDDGEAGIQGVMVTLTSIATGAGGLPLVSESTLTSASGAYSFSFLPPGTYNVVETQPGFYVNGTPTSNEYLNVSLVSGQSVANLNFGELGLQAQFVSAVLNRRAFLASTEATGVNGLASGTQNVNLTQGAVWISFDNGWQNARKFEELYDTTQGSVTMTLYNSNLNVIATSTPETGGSVLYGNATLGTPYFLKISGTSTDASLKITESLTPSSPTITRSATSTVPAVFTVTLSAPVTTAVTVAYATASGTATSGTDFTSETGTLTFAPGVTSENVTVPVSPSSMAGPSETFTLKLTNPTNAYVNGSGTATILNTNPNPTVSIANTSVIDPTAGTFNAIFTVSLSAASGSQATVAYTTAAGTAPTNDYTAESGTVTFAPGTTSQTITVPIKADSALTSSETFLVKLSNPLNATLGTATATGTILPSSTGSSGIALSSLATFAAVASPAVAGAPAISTSATGAATLAVASTTPSVASGAVSQSNLTGSTGSSSKTQATDQALADDDTWAVGSTPV